MNTTVASRSQAAAPARNLSPGRLLSLDALRGFTMFWIIGADAFYQSLHQINPEGFIGKFAEQFEHPSWVGFHFYDLIFPTFLFIIGVSIVFSLDKILATEGKEVAYKRILRRTALLFLLGVFYDEGVAQLVELTDQGKYKFDENILCGVLQRLALCYGIVSVLYINFSPKVLLGIFCGVLIGWWLLLCFVPAPDQPGVLLERGKNIAHYIDLHTPPFYDTDPESLSGTFTASCSCLLGVFVALFLRDSKENDMQKVLMLVGVGVAMVLVGFLWSFHFPIIKRLWTSTYVMVAGGLSIMLLALFYYVIDIMQYRKWATVFVWIGANPLTIYLVSNIVDFKDLARRFVGGPIETALGSYGLLVVNIVGLTLCILLVRYMYKRQIFIRV